MIQDILKIATIQTNLVWENPLQNRLNLTEKIASISENLDIIVLPEMFTSGFTMHPEIIAETMNGDTVQWMKTQASKTNAAIVGSIVITENNNYYNRLLFVRPSGEIDTYDKRHTFTLAGEHKIYQAGTEKKIINYKGWKICTLICYDLRFPVLARNVENYEVLIYVANWPKPRITAWDTLLKARAIENMSYTIGVNRVGLDANNYEYPGHSMVFDGLGNELIEKHSNEIIAIATLNKDTQKQLREKFRFLEDRDTFTLK